MRKSIIAAYAALSLVSVPAQAQTAAAGAASSSSSSASSAASSTSGAAATGGNASAGVVNNINNPRQWVTASAIGVAPAPTATCQKTHGFGVHVLVAGISFGGSKGDKECQFVQMLQQTVLIGPPGTAMACQLARNHWVDWRDAANELGIDCHDLLPRPVEVVAPSPPPPVAAPPPPPVVIQAPPQIIRETRIIYRTAPRHTTRKPKPKPKPKCSC